MAEHEHTYLENDPFLSLLDPAPEGFRLWSDLILDDVYLSRGARILGRIWCDMMGDRAVSPDFMPYWYAVSRSDLKLGPTDELPSALYLQVTNETVSVADSRTLRLACFADIGYFCPGNQHKINDMRAIFGGRLSPEALITCGIALAYGMDPRVKRPFLWVDAVDSGEATIEEAVDALEAMEFEGGPTWAVWQA